MNQISEHDFRLAVIATKKDAKLVAAAKNDRINSPESLYREFIKLSVDRQREIISSICNEHFVAAVWKISFVLNNFPASVVPEATAVAGKALFFTREEACVRESIRAAKVYQESPYLKTISSTLQEAAEVAGTELFKVAEIFTTPDLFGFTKDLDPNAANTEKILRVTGRVAMYTRDWDSTWETARFFYARRHIPNLDDYVFVIENAVFLRRDRRSVHEILAGFGAGAIDVVLQKETGNRQLLSKIRDVAWKTGDSRAIRDYLRSLQ